MSTLSNKVKHYIDWRELEDTPILAQKTLSLKVSTLTIPSNSSIQRDLL